MAKLVVLGATLKCSQGLAPSTLTVVPAVASDVGEKPVATIMDNKPMTNIAPFGMCQSPANPQVAAATSAAGGVLTPQPCVPVVAAPWAPGSAVTTLSEMPVLTDDSKCMCNWAGTIEITNSGSQVDVL
ncbi:MAG: DUF4280 domain-containing protein [Polyangiaceae bacterium]